MFEELKHAMTKVPMLVMLDFSQPFEIEADASKTRVGALLMQKGQPIAYFSQKLSERHQQCSVYEQELMVIVLAVKKQQHYLSSQPFVIETDQKGLEVTLGAANYYP